jgi:hypothetical protein
MPRRKKNAKDQLIQNFALFSFLPAHLAKSPDLAK